MPCFRFSVRAVLAVTDREEIKKMQKRRKSSRRRTIVRQRRFSAVEKAKTLFIFWRNPQGFRHHSANQITLKPSSNALFSLFRSALFKPSCHRGEIKSFGVFDFVAQGVLLYVARRNRAQKKRKRQISCRNPIGFRPIYSQSWICWKSVMKICFRFFGPDDFSLPLL